MFWSRSFQESLACPDSTRRLLGADRAAKSGLLNRTDHRLSSDRVNRIRNAQPVCVGCPRVLHDERTAQLYLLIVSVVGLGIFFIPHAGSQLQWLQRDPIHRLKLFIGCPNGSAVGIVQTSKARWSRAVCSQNVKRGSCDKQEDVGGSPRCRMGAPL